MRLPYLLFYYLSIFVHLSQSLTASINFHSNCTFSSKLVKTQSVIINGQEMLLMLFQNGSISKLNNRLIFQQSIKLSGGYQIFDFQMSTCHNCTNSTQYTPSIIVIYPFHKKMFALISLLNTEHSITFLYTNQIVRAYPFNSQINSSTEYSFECILFALNTITHKLYTYNNITSKFYEQFYHPTTAQMDDDVVNAVGYGYYYYCFTKYNYIYVYNINIRNLTVKTRISFTLMSILMDYPYIGVYRLQDLSSTTLNAYSFLNSSFVGSDTGLNFRILNVSSNLKAIRPPPSSLSTSTERIFIFDNQILLLNLSSGIYNLKSTLQEGFSFPSQNNMSVVFLQSTKLGFVHSSVNSTVYSYCQSLNNDCVNDSLLCMRFGNGCISCSQRFCTACSDNYSLVNGTCQPQCNISGCQMCQTLYTCRTCQVGYDLSHNDTVCVEVTLSIIPIDPNATIIDPGNGTVIDPGNGTENPTTIDTYNNTTIYQNNTLIQKKKILSPPFSQPPNRSSINAFYQSFHQSAITFIQFTSFINSSPLYRRILAFLSPVFGLFDDYWFYIYHNNSFDRLTLFPGLLVFMYAVNQQRIIPDFLQETINNCGISQLISAQDSYQNYTNTRISFVDQKPEFQTNLSQVQPNVFSITILRFIFFILHFLILHKSNAVST